MTSPSLHRSVSTRRSVVLLASLLVATAACSGGEDAGTAQAAPAGGAPGGAPGGGRGAASIVLSASDVHEVKRGPIEAGAAVSGDLRPIEEVSIRARLEGDLVSVLVREGDRVSRGQLLARFEASEQESDQESAAAERAAAEGELANAKWNAEQSAELFRAGAIPERDLKSAQQAVVTAQARLAAAAARVRSTSSFVVDTRVLAPTSGVVSQRLVENGERVARGAPMFTVVRNDVLELEASVPARQAEAIRVGQPVRFMAAGRGREGRVARVSPTIDPQSRALKVYVQIPNSDGALRGNTLATGRIVERTVPDAVVVPSTALRQGPEASTFVYRIADGAIARTPVTVGILDEAQGIAQVVSGLSAGDRVVVGNVGTIGDGMQVQVLGGRETQAGATAPAAQPAAAAAVPRKQ